LVIFLDVWNDTPVLKGMPNSGNEWASMVLFSQECV